MAEQLWRPCLNTKGMFPHRQDCECGGHFYAMVPVAAGALLIEDGFAVAVKRIGVYAAEQRRLGRVPTLDDLLAAAVGEETC